MEVLWRCCGRVTDASSRRRSANRRLTPGVLSQGPSARPKGELKRRLSGDRLMKHTKPLRRGLHHLSHMDPKTGSASACDVWDRGIACELGLLRVGPMPGMPCHAIEQ